jgi:hypothetical protein
VKRAAVHFCIPVFTARQITTSQLRDGAIAAAIGWQLLQEIGIHAVAHGERVLRRVRS